MISEGLWRDKESFATLAPLSSMDPGVSAVVQGTVGGAELSAVACIADVFVVVVVNDQ